MQTPRLMATAKTFCDKSGWTLSNLPLQKLVYLSHMVYLGQFNEPLVEGSFEAWDLGPVHPFLYRKVRAYGDRAVQDVFGVEGFAAGTRERVAIDSVAENLLNESPGKLVAITHQSRGAWAKVYRPHVMGIEIPNAEIAAEYQRRLVRKPETTN